MLPSASAMPPGESEREGAEREKEEVEKEERERREIEKREGRRGEGWRAREIVIWFEGLCVYLR